CGTRDVLRPPALYGPLFEQRSISWRLPFECSEYLNQRSKSLSQAFGCDTKDTPAPSDAAAAANARIGDDISYIRTQRSALNLPRVRHPHPMLIYARHANHVAALRQHRVCAVVRSGTLPGFST